jgi:hypothetical protein
VEKEWGRSTKEGSEVHLKHDHEIISNLLTNRVNVNNHNRQTLLLFHFFVLAQWMSSLMGDCSYPHGDSHSHYSVVMAVYCAAASVHASLVPL